MGSAKSREELEGSRDGADERDHSHIFRAEGNPAREQRVREKGLMKKEYDFSKAEQGKFYKRGAKLRLPIYLDAKLQHQVENLADRTGMDLGDVVHRILEKEVHLIADLQSPKTSV